MKGLDIQKLGESSNESHDKKKTIFQKKPLMNKTSKKEETNNNHTRRLEIQKIKSNPMKLLNEQDDEQKFATGDHS